jgi:hypothetical protein
MTVMSFFFFCGDGGPQMIDETVQGVSSGPSEPPVLVSDDLHKAPVLGEGLNTNCLNGTGKVFQKGNTLFKLQILIIVFIVIQF